MQRGRQFIARVRKEQRNDHVDCYLSNGKGDAEFPKTNYLTIKRNCQSKVANKLVIILKYKHLHEKKIYVFLRV